MSGNERRINARTSMLDVDVKVSRDGWMDWEVVETEDISLTGIRFVAQSKFSKEEKIVLRGVVADDVRNMDISCDVNIVYMSELPNKRFLYGASLSNLSKMQATCLGLFVELMVLKHPSSLVT
ncbi:MAG: hypothetical protein FWG87_09310 [Defluviitaleaceae bacterium]|nr:hypothetical protein [Defluviitaleaceae bacterium]